MSDAQGERPHHPSGGPVRVACVGASVTFGRGLAERRRESYPSVLGSMLDAGLGPGAAVVKNFGYSGATASSGGNEPYRKTPSFLAATRFAPHTTIVMLGTNDAQWANASSRETLADDLAAIVRYFRGLADAAVVDPGEAVLVAQPPPAFPPVEEIDFRALAECVRPAIAAAAEASGAPLVDFLTPLSGLACEFPDGLHPTAAVARRIAEIAYEAVAERVARIAARLGGSPSVW